LSKESPAVASSSFANSLSPWNGEGEGIDLLNVLGEIDENDEGGGVVGSDESPAGSLVWFLERRGGSGNRLARQRGAEKVSPPDSWQISVSPQMDKEGGVMFGGETNRRGQGEVESGENVAWYVHTHTDNNAATQVQTCTDSTAKEWERGGGYIYMYMYMYI